MVLRKHEAQHYITDDAKMLSSEKQKKGSRPSKNRYNSNWYLHYFENLPKKTARFPPNPDIALKSASSEPVEPF